MPGQQFGGVGMCGKATDGVDTGPDMDFLPKDAHSMGAVDDASGQCAARGIANEHHGVSFIPEIVFQMMTNTPAGAHAGAGHDDGAALDVVDGHRLGGFPGEVQPRQVERIVTIVGDVECVHVEALGMATEDLGGGDRHG